MEVGEELPGELAIKVEVCENLQWQEVKLRDWSGHENRNSFSSSCNLIFSFSRLFGKKGR